MKKNVFTAIVIIAAASICNARAGAAEKYSEMMLEGRPFFTDGGLYNSYHLSGSPLGRFDKDSSSRISADLGYGYFGMDGASGHYLSGQTLRMGAPGRAFFELFYGPDILSRKDLNTDGLSASATVQRFGLALAGQAAGGFFRAALSSEGYLGKQEWSEGKSDSSRAFMGFEKLRLDMGSSPVPLLRIGFHVDFTFHLDTLKAPQRPNYNEGRDNNVERIVQMNMPAIGGNIDFGGEEFPVPVRSNISVSQSWSRFVYTSKGARGSNSGDTRWPASGTNPTSDPNGIGAGNEYAVANDSLRLMWLTSARFPFADENYAVKPGLLIGFTNNAGNYHRPHEKNDPFKLSDAADSLKYGLGGFLFGIGAGFELLEYADLHAEYSLASMSLKLGSAEKYKGDFTDKRTLHHTAFGVSSPVHEYVNLPFELTPRLAYFISGSAGIVAPVHSNLDPLNTNPRKTRQYLYEPQTFLEGFTRLSGFTIGIDASALENLLSMSYWMTFLSSKAGDKSVSGTELGLSVGLSL